MKWEDNVLLITSDHGEEFLDHGQYGHLETLYRELTQVVFWLAGPGITPRSIETPLSLADTHHILLHALDHSAIFQTFIVVVVRHLWLCRA